MMEEEFFVVISDVLFVWYHIPRFEVLLGSKSQAVHSTRCSVIEDALQVNNNVDIRMRAEAKKNLKFKTAFLLSFLCENSSKFHSVSKDFSCCAAVGKIYTDRSRLISFVFHLRCSFCDGNTHFVQLRDWRQKD